MYCRNLQKNVIIVWRLREKILMKNSFTLCCAKKNLLFFWFGFNLIQFPSLNSLFFYMKKNKNKEWL